MKRFWRRFWDDSSTPGQQDKRESAGGCLVALMVIIAVGYALENTIWGEREGFVKTNDCRTTIPIKPGSPETWFKTFTCAYQKTKSGKIMGGTCQSVVLADNGVCETVYVYEKPQPDVCTDPKYPYLGYDDMCHTQ